MKLKCLLDCAISLMYIIKSKGPSMEPCGKAQMAVDKEAIGLSRVHMYES